MRGLKKTRICSSRAQCSICRDLEGGRKWRESLGKVFELPGGVIDFECPHGFDWGNTPEQVDPPKPNPRDICQYRSCRGCGGNHKCESKGTSCNYGPGTFEDCEIWVLLRDG